MPSSLEDLLRQADLEESQAQDLMSRPIQQGYGGALTGLGQLFAGVGELSRMKKRQELSQLIRDSAQKREAVEFEFKKAQIMKESLGATKTALELEDIQKKNAKEDSFKLVSGMLTKKSPDWKSLLEKDPKVFDKAEIETDPILGTPKTLKDVFGSINSSLPAAHQVQGLDKIPVTPETRAAMSTELDKRVVEAKKEISRDRRASEKEKDPYVLLRSANSMFTSNMGALMKLQQQPPNPSDTQGQLLWNAQRDALLEDLKGPTMDAIEEAYRRMRYKDASARVSKMRSAIDTIDKHGTPQEKTDMWKTRILPVLSDMFRRTFVTKADYDAKFLSDHPSNISKSKPSKAAPVLSGPDPDEMRDKPTDRSPPIYSEDKYPDKADYIAELVENHKYTASEAVKALKDQLKAKEVQESDEDQEE